MEVRSAAADPAGPASIREPRTTDGALALMNLQAQLGAGVRPGVHAKTEQIELLALRGHLLGRIDDARRAAELAERLARDAAADGSAWLARARTRAGFHRFAEALDDLDEAERLGAARAIVDGERAAVFQALGRYHDAQAIRERAAIRRPGFDSLAALAALQAEIGEPYAADALFDASRARYRTVSPFPLAMLDFQRGRMWMEAGDLDRAQVWLDSALRRVPAYAPAQGRLAAVHAAAGEHEIARRLLTPLAMTSDDPDYVAQLSRVLVATGQIRLARAWRERAAARYDALVMLHPAAFADHAAEFWLCLGTDPDRALFLAELNLSVRQTPRARDLVARAVRACPVRDPDPVI
jgi:tetratricopeptide (TPR) repeat protein